MVGSFKAVLVAGGAGSCRAVTVGRGSSNAHVWRVAGEVAELLEQA